MTPLDADMIQRDHALPSLGPLLEAEEYQQLLNQTLGQQDDFPTVQRCEPRYIRYKPGVNCVALFRAETLRTDEAGAFLTYGRASTLGTRTERGFPRARAVVEVAGGQIALYVFPEDRRLRILERVFDEERSRQLWASIPGVLSRPDESIAVRTIGYKPERRFVGALERDGEPFAAIKIQTGRAFAHALKTARSFSAHSELGLARPFAWRRRYGMMVMPWRKGTLASDVIRNGSVSDEEVARCGAALARIHTQHVPGLAAYDHGAALRHASAAMDGVVWSWPSRDNEASHLLERLRTAVQDLARAGDTSLVACHGDFYAKQILLQRNRVVVLDFDRSARGHPAWDLGTFVAHLVYDAVRGMGVEDRIPDLTAALLHGYRGAGGCVSDRSLAVYAALGLISLAPHPFRFRESNWPEQVDALLETARDFLERVPESRRGGTHVVTDDTGSDASDALNPTTASTKLSEALGTSVLVASAEVVRNKRGRRYTIRYNLERPVGGSSVLYGKVRVKGTDTRTHVLSTELFKTLSDSGDVRLAESVGVLDAWKMTVQRGIAGQPLSHEVVDAAVARRVVRATAAFHTSGVSTARTWTVADELAQIDKAIVGVVAARPQWRSRLSRLRASVATAAEELPFRSEFLLHRDLHPGNVLQLPGAPPALIDLDLAAQGPAAIDLGNFVGHLIEEGIRTHRSHPAVDAAIAAIHDEACLLYGAWIEPEIRLATDFTLLRHVHISTQFPERRRWTESILAYCEQSCAARESTESGTPSMAQIPVHPTVSKSLLATI